MEKNGRREKGEEESIGWWRDNISFVWKPLVPAVLNIEKKVRHQSRLFGKSMQIGDKLAYSR
jgi:hypothetical protein